MRLYFALLAVAVPVAAAVTAVLATFVYTLAHMTAQILDILSKGA